MGKLQEFDITFTNNKVVYGPGEAVSGTVRVRTGNSLQYKAIKVTCQGSCGISNKVHDTSWSSEEQYFNSTLTLTDKGTLTAGEHSFSFQFVLPVSAPTSFEGPFGRICYRVRAAIDTPRFSKDHKAQKPFYLLNLLNLNMVPDIEHSSSAVTTKKFSYLLVKTGTLMLKANSDLRGYIPGQVIRLATEIHNKSGKDTGCVLASLLQKVTYRTKRPVCDLRTIAEVEGAGVKAGKHAEWREQIIVPPLPQSELVGCSLIDIDYYIQSPDAVVTLPIYIGNIAVNVSPSEPYGSTPSSGLTPSAPPAEDLSLEAMCARGVASEEIPTKSHSQQDALGQPVTMSPSAFSHAPGATLPPDHRRTNASEPLFCVSTGATIPFFTTGNQTPIPTSCSLILPPEYSWDYPHEPPPTYEESCSSFNNQQ
ncbi:arrestin domain-containing protein 1b isoform X2 [Gouania willdenowi]|uniref:arrestin domain-containing protein 1b isoform X2 n=1 Tax=Gouania willdenowi TaxID=441366 RepID=UPI0010550EAF|nr:arrestin domain-containing protein 1 isoform X2 [Gouania willdenowi]